MATLNKCTDVKNPHTLENKTALITGASKRVGKAIAISLAQQGMTIGIHYNQSSNAAKEVLETVLVNTSSKRSFTIQADLSKRNECKTLIESFVQKAGQLDLLILNAANFESVKFNEIQEKNWDFAMKLNLEAPFFLSQFAAPYLKRSLGSIVAMTCSSTKQPYKNYLPYIVSKGALQHLVRSLALEMAPEVRVNAIAPGTVLPPEHYSDLEKQSLANAAPLKKTGSAEDIAQAVLYLTQANFVTGQEIRVDGGRTIGTALKG